MPSSSTIITAISILIPLLLIYAILRAFRDSRKDKTILCHIQILRRSIAASCILGFLLMAILPVHTKAGEWNYGGFVLFFISAINYGYAQRVEKAAIAAESLKK